MDPSSLIFVVIIAIWAAYLLGHWVRRRDQLATARSIDRFSEAMRVLERRTPTRPVSAARATARSYVVAPVRAPVAAPALPGRRVMPRALGAGSVGSAGQPGTRPSAGGDHEGTGTIRGVRTARVGAGAARAGSRGASERATFVGSAGRIAPGAARRRARLVFGLLLATAVAWLLAAVTSLVWWPAAVLTALLTAVLVQMRRTARVRPSTRSSSSARRRPARPASRRSGGSARGRGRRRSLASRVPVPARRRHHQDARAVLDQLGAVRGGRSAAVAASLSSRAAPSDAVSSATGSGSVPAVGEALVVADTVVAGTVLGAEPVGSDPMWPSSTPHAAGAASEGAVADGWQPVPVPPPTYTLKPKARPVVRRPVAHPDGADGVVQVADDGDAAVVGAGLTDAAPVEKVMGAWDEAADVRCAAAQIGAPAFDLDEILERRIAAGG